jgi:hypothetical protein
MTKQGIARFADGFLWKWNWTTPLKEGWEAFSWMIDETTLDALKIVLDAKEREKKWKGIAMTWIFNWTFYRSSRKLLEEAQNYLGRNVENFVSPEFAKKENLKNFLNIIFFRNEEWKIIANLKEYRLWEYGTSVFPFLNFIDECFYDEEKGLVFYKSRSENGARNWYLYFDPRKNDNVWEVMVWTRGEAKDIKHKILIEGSKKPEEIAEDISRREVQKNISVIIGTTRNKIYDILNA